MTRDSISRFQSSVCAPSNAMFVIGSGAICASSCVQRWKMLLPTKRMVPLSCACSGTHRTRARWRPREGRPTSHLQGAAQAQFAASLRLPVPLYFAYCGYGQSGRDSPTSADSPRSSAPAPRPSRATLRACRSSRTCSGPSPPRQCAHAGHHEEPHDSRSGSCPSSSGRSRSRAPCSPA